MLSPRKIAKKLRHHVRRAQIRALAAPRALPWLRQRLRLPSNHAYDPLRDGDRPGIRVISLDPPETFQRPLPLFVAADADAGKFFAERTTEIIPARYVAEFTDALAWGHPTGGVLTSDSRFVPALTHDPSGAAFHAVWTRVSLPQPRALPGRTLYLVTPEARDNYHHWMIDLLPRLGLVRRAGYDLASFDHVIVNFSRRGYQLATLAQLGISPDKLVAADESLLVRAERLVVPSLKASNQTLPAADVAFLRESFLGQSAPTAAPLARRRIFLSRADASFRRLQNELALRPMLEAQGFEIVSLGGLEIAAQAQLFAEADVIAGPAGAAFANLVFATAPARVIEIAPPQWLAAFHWMISARLGLAHAVLLGDGPIMKGIPDVTARHRDITLSPDKFLALFGRATAVASA